ncbi:M24 family metallopeptidase [Labrys monachus]|uniref:Xaa-Pro aminopeptidase n=1 Tax=Labrys monachus TaxID=217067 RepID=A0ABU0FJQ3_9HYPH|nr:M24 family metallopeptidase [Labrys monachus]MDQ0394841.1 Xaa-Pro aminopeptidase [Labrys monachus]
MSAVVPTYSFLERDRRWSLANELMEARSLDALLVYGDREGAFPAFYAPDTWLTNERPGSIVVFPKGEEPIAIVFLTTVIEDHIQAAATGYRSWIRPENIYAGKMGTNVVEIIEDHGLDKCKIGVVGLEPYPPYYFDGVVPYNTWKSIVEDLPDACFEMVGSDFFARMAAKSAEEIAVLKWSAGVGEKICAAMRDATRPGVGEHEIYAAALDTAARNVGYCGQILLGSGLEFVGWGQPAWLYRPQTPRTIMEGDVVLSEVFSSFGMLETQHQPAIAVGNVHADFHDAAALARASYEAGVKALKAGTVFSDVVEAMRAPMRDRGCWQVHPLVHSLTPYTMIGAGERLADLPEMAHYGKVLPFPSMGTDRVLEAGTVFALEPNCGIGRRMINLGGTVIVGENGGIELNSNSTRLMHA